MEVRPIDAVQVLHNINLHRRPTPVSEFESGFNNGLNQAVDMVMERLEELYEET